TYHRSEKRSRTIRADCPGQNRRRTAANRLTEPRSGASIQSQSGIIMQVPESVPFETEAAAAQMAGNIRRNCLRMVHASRLGHPGGDLSAADILAVLYSAVLRIDPQNPRMP